MVQWLMTAFSLQSSTGGGYSKYACSGETQSDGNILYQPAATMTLNSTHYMCFEVIKVVMQCCLCEITGQLLPQWRKNPSQAYSTCTFPQMVLAHHPFLCQLVQIPAAHSDVARSLLRQSKTTAHMSPAGQSAASFIARTRLPAWLLHNKAHSRNWFSEGSTRMKNQYIHCRLYTLCYLKCQLFNFINLFVLKNFLLSALTAYTAVVPKGNHQSGCGITACRILYPLFDLGFVDNVNCCDNDSDFVDVPFHT